MEDYRDNEAIFASTTVVRASPPEQIYDLRARGYVMWDASRLSSLQYR